jgi:hypothetical protein
MLICLIAGLAACAGEGTPPGDQEAPARTGTQLAEVVADLPSPAPAGSAEPRLFAAGDRVHMSWIEQLDEGGHAVRMASLDGGVWSPPATVVAADDLFVNWADFPSIVETADGGLAAHWLQRSGEGTYAYDVRMRTSADGGATWSPAFSPHSDGTQTEHGFATLVPEPGGNLTAVWLDGRETAGGPSHGESHEPAGAMTLRAATFDSAGAVVDEQLLDARTCDCCQTGAAVVGDDLLVVYRDRSDDEVRDIWLVARRDGAWTAPTVLSRDNWMIPGCPVNGPAISTRHDRVAVAWFALVDSAPEVKVVLSQDAGRTFSEPILIERGAAEAVTLGRVDAGWIDDDTAMVVWLTGQGEEAEVRYLTIDADGSRGEVGVAGLTRSTRSSGFPRLAVLADRAVLAWTIPGPPSRIEVTSIPFR